MENIAGYFHVLLVFTSALFGFSQYYENRQKKFIKEEQDKLRNKNLALADTKEIWEVIINLEPKCTNDGIAFALLILLVLYVISFTVGISAICYPVADTICIYVTDSIRVFSICLAILSIYIFINWWRMKSQLENFKDNIKTFNLLYDTVNKPGIANLI